MVLKLQISCICNKKELRFYSKTEIFGKVVDVWKWLLNFFLLNNLLVLRKCKI